MSGFIQPGIHYGRFNSKYNDNGGSIGRGTYGKVQTVTDPNTKTVYALKITSGELSNATNEMYIYCTYAHPNLMSAVDLYFMLEGENFVLDIIMYQGFGLHRFLNHYNPRIEVRESLIFQLVDVLAWLQENNIIYGDIKVTNAVIYGSPAVPILKLTDFGLYYKWQCGEPPSVSQTYSDLAGYQRRGDNVYVSPEIKDKVKYRYSVVANAMWALGMTITEILTHALDLSESLDDVPVAVYRIAENPAIIIDMNHPPQRWHPLILRLLGKQSSRPRSFTEIFTKRLIPVFNMRRSVGLVRRSPKLGYYPYESTVIDSTLNWIMRNVGSKVPVRNLASEYLLRYTTPAYLQLESYNGIEPYRLEQTLTSETYEKITTIPETGEVCADSYNIFAVACLLLGEAVLDDRYMTMSVPGYARQISTGDHHRAAIIARGIAYNIYKLLKSTNGSMLLRVPYFDDRYKVKDKNRMMTDAGLRSAEDYKNLIESIESGSLLVGQESQGRQSELQQQSQSQPQQQSQPQPQSQQQSQPQQLREDWVSAPLEDLFSSTSLGATSSPMFSLPRSQAVPSLLSGPKLGASPI